MGKRAWIGAAIVLAVAAAAVPEIAGRRTESRVRELVASANESGSRWQASIASYERAWTRSASVVRLRSEGGTDVAEIRTTWRHGPLGGINLATGTSELRLVGPAAEMSRQVFGDEAPVSATHTVGLDGSLRAGFATPPFDRAVMGGPVRVTGSGSTGTLTIDRPGRYALAHGYPKLTFAGGGNALEVDTVDFSADGRVGSAALETPAKYSLSIKSIRWAGDAGSMAIADPSLVFRMLPLGESLEFKLGHAVGPGRIEARGATHRWNRIEIQLTLADISRAAIEGLSRELRSISERPPSDPRRLELTLAAFSNASQALLKRDPSLSLDPFTFDGPDGAMSLTATARVDRTLLADGGLAALPTAISVTARLSIARSLARAWLAATLRQDARAADDVLDAAARAGLFREGADPIVVEMVAKDGRFLANGLSAERLVELREALLPSAPPRRRPADLSQPVPGAR